MARAVVGEDVVLHIDALVGTLYVGDKRPEDGRGGC